MFTGGILSSFCFYGELCPIFRSFSIIVQLMELLSHFAKLQSDGESRKKINQITRWLTIGITLFKAQLTSIIYIERYLVMHFY
jgi:preprotein translocase subunit SecY